MAASLAIGGVFLLAMVAATGYAVVTLPARARVPLHAGSPEYSYWIPKWAGLTVWLAAGALGFAVPALLSTSGVSSNWASSVRVTLTPAVMCVALALQAAALIPARRRYPRESAPDRREPVAAEAAAPTATVSPADPGSSGPVGTPVQHPVPASPPSEAAAPEPAAPEPVAPEPGAAEDGQEPTLPAPAGSE